MIFITLGSQKFQFDRLLKKIDELILEKKITEEVFAQIGYSTYEPLNYKYEKFMDREKFDETMNECNILITHGGTGAIINAIKKEKKVIAVPRLEKFGEHVDDHQIQITEQFANTEYITDIKDLDKLDELIKVVKVKKFKKFESTNKLFIESIKSFIER